MGLDFTSIPDREGAAIYLMHNAGIEQQRQMEHLAEQLRGSTDAQLEIIDGSSSDGRQIEQFYDLAPDNYPYVLIVRDDDELVAQWGGSEQPTAEQIAFTANAAN